MPVPFGVVGLLVTLTGPGPGPGTAAPAGYCPSGSAVDLYDLGRLARLRDPGVRPLGFSLYDRTGGNDDGFRGTDSRLRTEGKDSVLAEMDGPGIIQRIWFTHSRGERPGLLDHQGEHIRIYLDGGSRPALDLPLEDLFRGDHPRFPRPLVGEGSGGFFCSVPIAFTGGCKVVAEGLGVRFYQVGMVRLPSGATVQTFTVDLPRDEAEHLAAVALWSDPESASAPVSLEKAEYVVDAPAGSSYTFALPSGPRTIRHFEVIPTGSTEEGWRSSRLRMAWDGDEESPSGVNVPLGYLFGQALGSAPYRSVLVSQTNEGWSARFPMPYRQRGRLHLETHQPVKGKFRIWTASGVEPDAGYFRADYHEALPTRSGVDFPWLTARGRGHYAGTFLATQGRSQLPLWMEGDDRFVVDGEPAIHGTGSEDYFNGGWYALAGRLDQPATYSSHGFPVYRQGSDRDGSPAQVVAYRWHLADPVPYTRSIQAGIEHGEANTFAADYRAAVFWYSERPGS